MAFLDVYNNMAGEKKYPAEKKKSKAEWVQERKEEISSLSATADEGIVSITSVPDAYKQFLELMVYNPELEVLAAAAMVEQADGATVLKSMDNWNKLGRRIKKGEKGFRVLCGTQKINTLFDQSQTQGDALSEKQTLRELTPRMQKALSALIDSSPVVMVVNKDMTDAAAYDPQKGVIEVNTQKSEYQVFAELCREVCLAKFHMEYDLDFSRTLFLPDAKSAAYIICMRLGVPMEKPDCSWVEKQHINTSVKSRLASLEMIKGFTEEIYGDVKSAAFPDRAKVQARKPKRDLAQGR